MPRNTHTGKSHGQTTVSRTVHMALPAGLNVPAGQGDAKAEPRGQALPAGHGPQHAGVVSALALPSTPAGHRVQLDEPCCEYDPGSHASEVALAVPGAHAYPAGQGPLHEGLTCPAALPKRPAGHTPVQLGEVREVVAPYSPGAHAVQVPAPPIEYVPAVHAVCVATVEP